MNYFVLAIVLLTLPGYWALFGYRLASRISIGRDHNLISHLTMIASVSAPISTIFIALLVAYFDSSDALLKLLAIGQGNATSVSLSEATKFLHSALSLIVLSISAGLIFGKLSAWGVPGFMSFSSSMANLQRGIRPRPLVATILCSPRGGGHDVLYRGIVKNMQVSVSGEVDWVLMDYVHKCPLRSEHYKSNDGGNITIEKHILDEDEFFLMGKDDPFTDAAEQDTLYISQDNISNIYIIPLEPVRAGDILDYIAFFIIRFAQAVFLFFLGSQNRIAITLLVTFTGCTLYVYLYGTPDFMHSIGEGISTVIEGAFSALSIG